MATIALIMMPIGAFLIFWAAFLRRAYANVPLKKSPLYPGFVVPKPLVTVVFIFVILFIAVRWGAPEAHPLPAGVERRRKVATPRRRRRRTSNTSRISSGCRSS